MATRGRPTNKRSGSTKAAQPRKGSAASKKEAARQADRDVTQYADKEPTELHRCYARWIVDEVGYNPNHAGSKREAFLMGVSISTVARNVFTASDYLAEWREESGETKRGPKPKDEKSSRSRQVEEEPEDEDYDDEDEDDDDDDDDSWTEEDVEERQEELTSMTVAKLKAFAKSDCEATAADLKGLKTKADVVNYILDYEFPEDEEDDEDDDDEGEEDFEDDDEDDEEDDEEEVEEAPKSRRSSSRGRQSTKATSPKSSKKSDYLF